MLVELAIDSGVTLALYKGAGFGLSSLRSWVLKEEAKLERNRRKRIFELERATGQTDYDSDTIAWLKKDHHKPTAVNRIHQNSVDNGSGSPEVYCQLCGDKYFPKDHCEGTSYYNAKVYEKPGINPLRQTYCLRCIPAMMFRLKE